MINLLKRHAAAILAALTVSLPAAATTYSTDYTDLWFIPAESGWGVNLTQQHEIIFATMFVFGSDNSDRWFTASEMTPTPTGSQTTWSGTLYRTTGGTYFGSPWNPATVARPAVGTITLTFSSPNSATLTYSVNGVNVTKSITRFTWRFQQLAGHYIGGLTANGTNCRTVANGPILAFDNLSVAQNGTQVTMTVIYFTGPTTQAQWTFTGVYTGSGKLGTITGTFTATTGNAGSFTLSAINASPSGFSGLFSGSDQYCTYNGYFGGTRDVI